ncbi:hypothetical protein BFP70_04380 [Thioclava sp. SK-1]|uniref:type VI secretion system-associated FHA domain protein TagH n=1 Tax=Thioclava sp. SK-1 TaxID=1889770 RepID=UPI0008255708|nr:type VI secretion system-associated FHA domain protein TagH [Thioclava sp. SK-1]OCX66475.1 hypothetical protein BFP70_04380 [Thioclava sp. SK-1]
MSLVLRIENYDMLEDGGPAWFALERRGASIGRRVAMDWVLPDPQRHISGHHFDIEFRDSSYWLTDVSTNGTFLQGHRYRIQGPHQLQHGERLIVGHYIIAVELAQISGSQPASDGSGPAQVWTSADDDADPWDFGAPMEPVNPHPAPHQSVDPFALTGQDFVGLQAPQIPPVPPVPPPGVGAMPPPPAPSSLPPLQRPALQQDAYAAPLPPPPHAMPQSAAHSVPGGQPFSGGPVARAETPPDTHIGVQDMITAFCEGAGIDPALMAQQDPIALAKDLGHSLRITTDEVMRMLQDRANVKQFTRGGDRTMRSATGNNPLKFMPDPQQALEAMYARPRDGFMAGPEGLENALGDLRQHQMAVFSALQPALAELLHGLAPEDVEAVAQGGSRMLPGNKRGKNWDIYVDLWAEKCSAGEHGMLDAFLQAFARAYIAANSRPQ